MRRLWLVLLPFFFVPDLGMATSTTGLGTAEFSDYLVFPYIFLVYFGGTAGPVTSERARISKLMLMFFFWAALSSATINLRYGYGDPYYLQFSLVKIGKLLAYGLAGVLTIRALEQDPVARRAYPWVMLAACLVAASGFIGTQGLGRRDSGEARVGFGSKNGMSVALGFLYCWLIAFWGGPASSAAWAAAAAIASPALLYGFFVSDGRAGWIAGLLGGCYAAVRLGVRPVVAGIACVGLGTAIVTYEGQDSFRAQVDMTVNPETRNYQSDFTASTGVDDGDRIKNWTHEAERLVNAPLLGTGLYHRGGRSTLWETGSHNYWLQMFLETGLVGGTLVLLIMRELWRMGTSPLAESAGIAIGHRAALVAAFIGGMSGEYFYGGKMLLALFMVIAPVASLPRSVPALVPSGAPPKPALPEPVKRPGIAVALPPQPNA
jgi:hypothetical protein